MFKELIINEVNKEYDLFFNKENPFLNIQGIQVEEGNIDQLRNDVKITLNYSSKNSSGSSPLQLTRWHENNYIDIRYVLKDDLERYDKLSIQVESSKELENFSITIFYQNINFLDVSTPVKLFDEHLNSPFNQKIFFSAPFGHGKSTFLDLYFNQDKSYNIFKVFPVNYSVAENEDIFRYIKTDILFQLLEKDIEIEANDVSFFNAASDIFINDPVKSISTLIKIGLSLNKRTSHFIKTIDLLKSTYDKIIEKQKELKEDYLEDIEKYVNQIFEQEGSIYEDNLYTQLIRLFLSQLKEKESKKNILIIDDLDRLDPDHIFRILNILSAHIDSFRNGNYEESNKFGFDKIIIVAHLENVRSIYHHKYGLETDFSGYINKFYSTGPFEYNNQIFFKSLLDSISRPFGRADYEGLDLIAHSLLEVMFDSKMISIRDYLKLIKFDYYGIAKTIRDKTNYHYISGGHYIPIISFLSEVYSTSILLKKISICDSKKILPKHINFNDACIHLMLPLTNKVNQVFEYDYLSMNFIITKENRFSFEYDLFRIEKYVVLNTKGSEIKYNFTIEDFYFLLKQNIIIYDSAVSSKQK